MPTPSAAALQAWVSREPRLSPHSDRTGRGDRVGLKPAGHSVLVVDDDRGVLQLTARMLRLEGYTVLEATSGAEALQVLETKPDIRVVVTDVMMPGMHGLDLVERILERERRPEVVLMTGHAAQLSGQLEGRDPSMPLLLKPFTSQQLVKTVRHVLRDERH